jgi:flagellar basal-body rod protein FlgC
MADFLVSSMKAAGAGLEAQSARIRVVAENLANAQSSGKTPGAEAYRRKTISFEQVFDAVNGFASVKVAQIGRDRSALPLRHEPSHPAADARGYVKMPNVNTLMELTDMRQANQAYEANLQMISMSKRMLSMTIDLLRNGR